MTYDVENPALDCSNCAALQAKVERYQNILAIIQYSLNSVGEVPERVLSTLRTYVDRKVKEFNED